MTSNFVFFMIEKRTYIQICFDVMFYVVNVMGVLEEGLIIRILYDSIIFVCIFVSILL